MSTDQDRSLAHVEGDVAAERDALNGAAVLIDGLVEILRSGVAARDLADALEQWRDDLAFAVVEGTPADPTIEIP